ncbi:hypothetical protein EIK77_009501 [Talaromyces pinophilus]|nr:hypothetical protein EIK77_009501 [Talaromyces pinophilus]PCG92642.1 hypothetical protein PENOC_091450 [Penicillium occitanis (nom. inval.)]PCH01618.1 Hypothetical protein PENO1_041890 [Penicillium occitanis (nom. inval.)]
MPDPMQLPHELRLMILNHAADQEDSHEYEWAKYQTKRRALSNLSLVSKSWHAILIRQIYSTWEYDCDFNSISSLWKFLRTILSNSQIADTVREIRYSSYSLGTDLAFYAERPPRPPFSLQDDRDMIRNAICTAGLAHIKPDVINAINNADPRPLLALLLANLQNLQILRARIPHTDMFLAGVFREAVRRQPPNPLLNLREVYLECIPWRCYECKYPQYIHVSLLWPIFQLPAIQRVSVSDFKPHEGASRAEYAEDFGDIFEASTVTDLNLVLNAYFARCLATPDSLILLSLPKRLTRLSIFLKGSGFRDLKISNVDIWNAIRPHEESIEYLSVDRWECGEEDDTRFGSLRGFERLKHLYIQPRLLSDTDSLGDTLPPNCQSLNFYLDGASGFTEHFSQRLLDYMSRVHLHTPYLWHIALDVFRKFIIETPPIYDQMKIACAKQGIKFEDKCLTTHSGGPQQHW